jgi:hypothetical protein
MPSILTPYAHKSGAITSRLKACTQFEVRPDASSSEWFQLRSTALTSQQLFTMLKAVWPAIVGAEPQKYALIHCKSGVHAGVWFHLLPNADYEPGCHEVATF